MKRLAALLGAILAIALPLVSQAQTPPSPSNIYSSGTIAANGQAVIASRINGQGACTVQAAGTWVGTLAFQAATDNVPTWAAVAAVENGANTVSTTTSTNGRFNAPVTGATYFQVIATAWTSGSATINVVCSRPNPVNLSSSGGGGTVQPGNTQNTTPWLTAGGTTLFTITSASTTACTNLRATAGRLWSITNSGPATVVFPAFYNDAGATCGSTAAVMGDASTITLGPGQVITWSGGMPVSGLAYKLSGALTAGQNLLVVAGPQ